jgi:hypothetical membrane protein
MARSITNRSIEAAGASSEASTRSRSTRRLLACGVVAGPLFIVVSFVQAFTRPGFDITRHAFSQLSLGDLGWIQIANFLLTGLLAIAWAVGIRQALHAGRAGTWGPLLIGAYGTGMFFAGIFRTDPAMGWPPGSPAGMPASLSWHANLHSLFFFLAFIGLVASCVVFARRFAGLGQTRWTAYCVATVVADPVLIVAGSTNLVPVGLAFAALGTLTSAWIFFVALRLLSEQRGGRSDESRLARAQ